MLFCFLGKQISCALSSTWYWLHAKAAVTSSHWSIGDAGEWKKNQNKNQSWWNLECIRSIPRTICQTAPVHKVPKSIKLECSNYCFFVSKIGEILECHCWPHTISIKHVIFVAIYPKTFRLWRANNISFLASYCTVKYFPPTTD